MSEASAVRSGSVDKSSANDAHAASNSSRYTDRGTVPSGSEDSGRRPVAGNRRAARSVRKASKLRGFRHGESPSVVTADMAAPSCVR